MIRVCFRVGSVAAVVASLVASLSAAGPAIFMLYGGPLTKPLFIVQRDLSTFAFLSCAEGYDFASDAAPDGPFVSVAIFWDARAWTRPGFAETLLPTLRPEDAGQHARVYLPRNGNPPAVFVTTNSRVVSYRTDPADFFVLGQPKPVPTSKRDFDGGCGVPPASVEVARRAGILGE